MGRQFRGNGVEAYAMTPVDLLRTLADLEDAEAEEESLPERYPVIHKDGYDEISGKYHYVTIEPRPLYCDRGHWEAKAFPVPGSDPSRFTIEANDMWPRMYMNYDRAVAEIRDWLAWREKE